MSDTWYRDPPDLPPYQDWQGRLWALDGTQVGGPPEKPLPDWLTAWPGDLRFVAFEAAILMECVDEYDRLMDDPRLFFGDWAPPEPP